MKSPILVLLYALSLLQLPTTPKARIEGTVVRAGNGDAVPSARVILLRGRNAGAAPVPPPAAIPPVTTDSQGRFAIPDLDEGPYTLQVRADGFVDFNYGQRYINGPGLEMPLKAGQILKDLAITLTPAGTISGRIRDREDRPLMNVPVQLLRFSYDAQARRTYQTVGIARTDDRGDYRIHWMTPGRYYLLAGNLCDISPAGMTASECSKGNVSANFIPVPMSVAYFPGVPDIASAQPLDLKPGAELSGVSLTVPPKPPTYRIRGRVIDARNGQPPAGAVVAAFQNSSGILANAELEEIAVKFPLSSYNAATGEFEAKGLVSGDYTLSATAQATSPTSPLHGSVKVTIPNADVQGITISISPASTIAGRVRVDGTLPIPMERLRLQLISTTPSRRPEGPSGNLSPDGTFSLQGVAAGDFRVALQVAGPPGANPVYIKEARYGAADVLNGPLQIGTSVAGPLDIVIGVGGGQLSGTLSDARGQPVPVSQVVLVPQRGRDRAELYRTSTTGNSGGFQFSGIVPGDYKVFSWEGIEPNGWFDPELLKQSETRGTAVHITDSATSSTGMIEVRLIPGGAR
jgi:hypothetical protein